MHLIDWRAVRGVAIISTVWTAEVKEARREPALPDVCEASTPKI
jgi:hypothetical protein